MKDSGIPWLGQIPELWAVSPIGRVFREVNSLNSDLQEDNALQFKMGEIVSKKEGNSKYNPETLEAYNVVEPGTIMINGLNLSFDFISQRVALVKEKGVITSTYLAIFPCSHVKSDFAKFLLKAYDNCKALHAMGRGLRATLSYSTFRSEFFLLPPLPEQERIAEYLDGKCAEIDELIRVEEQMIAELQAYKQSVITETVTRGLNPAAPLKDSGIPWLGQIPEHWEVMRNKDVFQESKEVVGEEASSYTLLSLTKQGVIVRDLTESKGKFPKEFDSYKKVAPNDMVFCLFDMDETPRTVGLSNRFGMITGAYDIFKVKRAFPRYVLYYFLSVDDQKAFRPLYKGLRKVVQMPTFLAIRVSLPPIPEQKAIAEYLDRKCEEIDALVDVKQRKIEELKEYKKSVIYEYVTGKREIV